MKKHGRNTHLAPIQPMRSHKSHPILTVPSSPKPGHSVKALQEGIKALEDFGFRAEPTLTLPPRLTLLTEQPADRPSKPLLHVTDLWSLRQQVEFLNKTGLKQAQKVRERQERKEAYLTSLERVEEGRENDLEYERLMAETHPAEAAKFYAAGQRGRFMKQLRNQVVANSPGMTQYPPLSTFSDFSLPQKLGPRQWFKELLCKCEDTMKRTDASRR